MTSTDYSENALVEQPAIALFEELSITHIYSLAKVMLSAVKLECF